MTQPIEDLSAEDKLSSSTELSTIPINKRKARQNLCTPRYLFEEINRRYGPFDVDVAADESNALCVKFFDENADGLTQDWVGNVWCNPPYKAILPWVYKAVKSTFVDKESDRVVMLLPARVGQEWWKYAQMYGVIHRLKGRVRFEHNGETQRSPFEDSVLVVFEREIDVRKLSQQYAKKKANGKGSSTSTD